MSYQPKEMVFTLAYLLLSQWVKETPVFIMTQWSAQHKPIHLTFLLMHPSDGISIVNHKIDKYMDMKNQSVLKFLDCFFVCMFS